MRENQMKFISKSLNGGSVFLKFLRNEKTYEVKVSAGQDDTVVVIESGESLFVLIKNYTLNYVGIDVVALTGEDVGTVITKFFEQSPDENPELCDWKTDMTDKMIVRTIAEFLEF